MSSRSEIEAAAVARFLETAFDGAFTPGAISEAEAQLIEGIGRYVDAKMTLPKPLTYVLNLALDFAMVAQKIGVYDRRVNDFQEDLDEATLFARYPPEVSTPERNVNTLTFRVAYKKPTKKGEVDATKRIGIRPVEEALCDLFMAADRTGFTSGYIYNTGMWNRHKDLLVDCFKLSESGRYLLIQRLIDYGLARFPKNTFFGRDVPRPRLFEQVIADYPRSATGSENAGMVMQGIAYGYLKADRPHLSLVVDKSRTGSAKQRRFGDVDGYYGLDLEVSVEVKDDSVTAARVETELGQFARDVHHHRVQGLAFVTSVEPEARDWLARFGVAVQDVQTTLDRVRSWDWRKQDDAVHGLLHFLAHVEQKPEAVTRLLMFIRSRDPSHDALAYLKSDESEQA